MVASLASKIGSWRPVVAAAWLMTSLTASAALIVLLQTANAAPAFLFALSLARSHSTVTASCSRVRRSSCSSLQRSVSSHSAT
jgi:hypothetical protein